MNNNSCIYRHIENQFTYQSFKNCLYITFPYNMYEEHLESKERFAIQRYLLIIGKKQNMQVLSHTFTYFST